jgi:hypothetical protein
VSVREKGGDRDRRESEKERRENSFLMGCKKT